MPGSSSSPPGMLAIVRIFSVDDFVVIVFLNLFLILLLIIPNIRRFGDRLLILTGAIYRILLIHTILAFLSFLGSLLFLRLFLI